MVICPKETQPARDTEGTARAESHMVEINATLVALALFKKFIKLVQKKYKRTFPHCHLSLIKAGRSQEDKADLEQKMELHPIPHCLPSPDLDFLLVMLSVDSYSRIATTSLD